MNIHLKKFFLFTAFTAMIFSCKKSNKNIEPPGAVELKDSVIVSNLSHPWEILWGPDNHIWMTEREGKISRLNPATGNVSLLHTVTDVSAMGEGGLLGMTLHPDFPSTPYIYVVYNYNSGSGYNEKVVRYSYNGSGLQAPFILIDNLDASNIHNGSRLLFVDGKLFITTGDASNAAVAQNKDLPNGKILRLNPDGSIPTDNPELNNPFWSMGHRNPQGLVFANGKLYSSEHGPGNDDEINIIEKGRNYGWPNVQGACNSPTEQAFCSTVNVAEPIKSWTPTIATCGLDYYNSDLIPQWKNSLLLVALKNSRLYQIKLDNNFTTVAGINDYYTYKYGRLRDLCISPEGKVYIASSNGTDDKIVEITKK